MHLSLNGDISSLTLDRESLCHILDIVLVVLCSNAGQSKLIRFTWMFYWEGFIEVLRMDWAQEIRVNAKTWGGTLLLGVEHWTLRTNIGIQDEHCNSGLNSRWTLELRVKHLNLGVNTRTWGGTMELGVEQWNSGWILDPKDTHWKSRWTL